MLKTLIKTSLITVSNSLLAVFQSEKKSYFTLRKYMKSTEPDIKHQHSAKRALKATRKLRS